LFADKEATAVGDAEAVPLDASPEHPVTTAAVIARATPALAFVIIATALRVRMT
jgi:hypothetical protein